MTTQTLTPTTEKTYSRSLIKIIAYGALTLGALFSLLPFLWMLSTSLKPATQLMTIPPIWIPTPIKWDNYSLMAKAIPIGRMLLNTVFVTGCVTFGQVVCCCLAGYSFARLRFRGRDRLFLVYLGTMMVPFMVTLVPSYALMSKLGWIDRYEALIIPGLFGSAYGTFLMRQFFMTLPKELEDAAVLDGCTPFGVFWRIFLPLVKPAAVTLAIFTGLGVWNDFIWPLVVIQSNELKTLTVGLASFQGLYGSKYNLLMAGTVVSVLPMLFGFIFAQRYFVEAISMTGMKS